jgi:hypothetical protein
LDSLEFEKVYREILIDSKLRLTKTLKAYLNDMNQRILKNNGELIPVSEIIAETSIVIINGLEETLAESIRASYQLLEKYHEKSNQIQDRS